MSIIGSYSFRKLRTTAMNKCIADLMNALKSFTNVGGRS